MPDESAGLDLEFKILFKTISSATLRFRRR